MGCRETQLAVEDRLRIVLRRDEICTRHPQPPAWQEARLFGERDLDRPVDGSSFIPARP